MDWKALVTGRNYASVTRPLAQRMREISPSQRQEEARQFISEYCEFGRATTTAMQRRLGEVSRQLRRWGTYEHTLDELIYGARAAWRNHSRCIGRLFWESLRVVDCRSLVTPEQIAERMAEHMREALGDGRITSIISIFAPMIRDRFPAYIESPQITQYAGYLAANGVVGDRQNVELTRVVEGLGHRSPNPPGPFDMLPLLIRDTHERRSIYPLPSDSYREIHIEHPELSSVSTLGLKWYAVPCVSNMILTIGGIDYPCAPFNGFYMGTEIASRNFMDKTRYNLLQKIGRAIGCDHEAPGATLWQDRALTELNRAVLHSYQKAGVTMVDHHSASEQFARFCQREHGSGRHVSADRAWIVPPEACSQTAVYHLNLVERNLVPNFYRHRSDDGRLLMPYYGNLRRGRLKGYYDRVRARWWRYWNN